MRQQQNVANTIADGLGLSKPQALFVNSGSSQVEISRIICGPETIGMTSEIPATEALALGVFQTDLPDHEVWSRGRPVVRQAYKAGSMQLVDLADEYSANILSPHEVVALSIPRAYLNSIADESGLPAVGRFGCVTGVTDPVIVHLVRCLQPTLQRPHEANPLFTEYVVSALCVHLLHRYGTNSRVRISRGGLSPLQLKCAKELIAGGLTQELSLAEVAKQCGLSREHFSRAFKVSTGMAPHQWGQLRRIDLAKQMLAQSSRSIADVALALGFADQSHLTRVFSCIVGKSPAQWRRDS